MTSTATSDTKTQRFLTGKRIAAVRHEARKLILELDDGTEFSVGVAIGFCNDYRVSHSLDFGFKENK